MSSPLHPPVGPHCTDHLAAGVEEPTASALPIAKRCVWCTPPHVISNGTLPASDGMCDAAVAREMARLDALEAGRIGATDPVIEGYARAIRGGLDLLFGERQIQLRRQD